MRTAVGLAALLAAVSVLAVSSLGAQSDAERAATSPAGETDSVAIATLAAWADQVWLSLLDRDGAYRGRLAEEGVFQRFNPEMNDEYELEIRSSLFHPSEDARWAELPNGLRIAGASISHPHILNAVNWRQEIHISGPVDLMARYRRERSLTARRDYPWVGMRWRDVLGTRKPIMSVNRREIPAEAFSPTRPSVASSSVAKLMVPPAPRIRSVVLPCARTSAAGMASRNAQRTGASGFRMVGLLLGGRS